MLHPLPVSVKGEIEEEEWDRFYEAKRKEMEKFQAMAKRFKADDRNEVQRLRDLVPQDLSGTEPVFKLPSSPTSPIVDPHLSPDVSMIAYVRGDDLHTVGIGVVLVKFLRHGDSSEEKPGGVTLLRFREMIDADPFDALLDWDEGNASPGYLVRSILSGQKPLRKVLYPHIEPYDSRFLIVSGVHTIYYEQSGNPQGHPVVFLHGGPGAGTSPGNRRFFDLVFFRIVLFDQRGAGRSTPHACLEENTTWDLVANIEKLREHLGIPECLAIIVFGGSWGSTLALVYSQTHPDKVTGIVLRGIFLLRKKELDWFYEGGAEAIFLDAWEPFSGFIPEDERNCFIVAYNKRLTSLDTDVQVTKASNSSKRAKISLQDN
ncbi:hypothetical protein ABZP36_012040 [Zizania latifolia]